MRSPVRSGLGRWYFYVPETYLTLFSYCCWFLNCLTKSCIGGGGGEGVSRTKWIHFFPMGEGEGGPLEWGTHWKGWALKLRLFLALKWQRAKLIHKTQTPANPPSARLCLRASILVGSSYLPPPSHPWVTRRGEKWREGDSHHLQHSHVTSLPSYLGWGDGQQQQQQFFYPHPSTQSAHSVPLPLPPYCTKCSILVWRGE